MALYFLYRDYSSLFERLFTRKLKCLDAVQKKKEIIFSETIKRHFYRLYSFTQRLRKCKMFMKDYVLLLYINVYLRVKR